MRSSQCVNKKLRQEGKNRAAEYFSCSFPYFYDFDAHPCGISRLECQNGGVSIQFTPSSLIFSLLLFSFNDNRICQRKQQQQHRIYIKLKTLFYLAKNRSLRARKNSVKYGSRWSNNIFLCFWFYDDQFFRSSFFWWFFSSRSLSLFREFYIFKKNWFS